jgi:hypothetical protein
MNSALQAAGSDLIIKYCDLVDGGGFILSNQGMSERAWAKAAFSKKARKFG